MARRLTAADLIYDEVTHTTRTPDGIDVPHTTKILRAVGVSRDFDDLGDRVRRVRENLPNASARGTAVHADCHAFDDDDLPLDYFASGDGRIVPFVKAWERVREAKRLKPLVHARERLVYHPVYSYAGILDGIFECCDVGLVLVDLKTGDPEDAAAHLQTAAYAEAWLSEHKKEKIAERWAVWLRPERVVPYTIINYSSRPDARLDFGKFAACVTVYYEQAERRRKVA